MLKKVVSLLNMIALLSLSIHKQVNMIIAGLAL